MATVLATVEYNVPTTVPRPGQRFHHSKRTVRRKELAPVGATDSIITRIRNVIVSVKANTGAIVFQVTSEPAGANIVLTPVYGQPITAPTNSTIPNFYRGIYTVTVTKYGYKTVSQPMQDFWTNVIGVKCTLRSNQDADEALFCEMIRR